MLHLSPLYLIMKRTALTALFSLPTALAASAGCNAALPSTLTPGASTYSLTIPSRSVIGQTTQREFIVHLPANYSAENDVPASLVLALHGQSLPARSMERISELSSPEFNAGSVIVYPQGIAGPEAGVQWLSDPIAPPSSTLDDRIFVAELLDHLTFTLCLDERRLYALGLSNGGGLTGLLMCDPTLNTRFAAFATVAGAFYPDSSLTEPLFQAGCNPNLRGRRLPYLNLHGLADGVIAYNGSNADAPASLPVRPWVDGWAARNGCQAPSEAAVEGGSVTEVKWQCGGQKDLVVHRAIEGFGHGWPSIKGQGEPFETLRGGPTGWDATPLILRWLSGWSL
ncbi:hypothetical protein SVAN01_10142 [Stagonosporopsis vannaccii]|nr:hypothetical protein SVAN01_10142 [Stagonosporopsis vannaccii]